MHVVVVTDLVTYYVSTCTLRRGAETWGFRESPSYPRNVGKVCAFFLGEKEWSLAQIDLYIGTVIVIRNFLQSQTF